LAPDPGALRAEVLHEAAEDHSIILRVLATNWQDEFQTAALWQCATKNWMNFGGLNLENLHQALSLSTQKLRTLVISTLLEQCESVSEKDSYNYRGLLGALPRYCSEAQFEQIAALAPHIQTGLPPQSKALEVS
jgi:hypothetical protein